MALKIEWQPISASGPGERSAHVMAVDDGNARVIVHGGMTPDENGDPLPYSDLWVLKGLDGTPKWEPVAAKGDVPCKREGHTMCFCKDLSVFVVFGGSDDQQEKEFNDVYLLDKTLTWKKAATTGKAPAPRLNHAAAIVGQDLYIFGGFEDGEAKNDLYKLDLQKMKWTPILVCVPTVQNTQEVPNSPTRRCNHSMTACGQNLFVFGGRGGETLLFNDLHCFDTETNTWKALTPTGQPPSPRDFHTTAVCNEKIYVFGGAKEIESQNVFEYYNDVVVYDTVRNSWMQPPCGTSKPSVRWGHAADTYQNKMIIFGGTASEVDLKDTHILTISGNAIYVGDSTIKAPPRRKPSASARPVLPSKPAPIPPSQTASILPSTASKPVKPANVSKLTSAPSLSFDIEQPPPVRIASKAVDSVKPRNLSTEKTAIIQTIDSVFAQLSEEFAKVDKLRAQLDSDRDAFEKEKQQNEKQIQQQQQSLRDLQEAHKRETQQWLKDRCTENDDERAKIAAEWEAIKVEQQRLNEVEARLTANQKEVDEQKADLEKRRKKMEAIMAQL
eukprot:gene8383-10202_t